MAEHNFLDMPCGIMDQFVTSMAVPGATRLLNSLGCSEKMKKKLLDGFKLQTEGAPKEQASCLLHAGALCDRMWFDSCRGEGGSGAGFLDAQGKAFFDCELLLCFCFCACFFLLTCFFVFQGHAMLLDCRSEEPDAVPLFDSSLVIVVTNSNVKHKLAGSQVRPRPGRRSFLAKYRLERYLGRSGP